MDIFLAKLTVFLVYVIDCVGFILLAEAVISIKRNIKELMED